jgi:hypothetical protein
MDFYHKLDFNFTPIQTEFLHLNEEEWKEMIRLFCIRLEEKPTSNILINKLHEFMRRGYKIILSNYDRETDHYNIYPKVKYVNEKLIIIIIPNLPYFVNIEIIDLNNFERCEYFKDCNEKIFKWVKMHQIIVFAHELIHCLRFFETIIDSNINDESNTIYGIESQVLSYTIEDTRYIITENMIRKDFNLKPRISHDSKEIFCYLSRSTYSNYDKFTKEDFYN